QVFAHRGARPAQGLRVPGTHGLAHLFARLREAGTRAGDLGERLPLEPGGLIDGGDQVGDQVVATDQFRIYVRARLFDALVQLLDPVVTATGGKEHHRDPQDVSLHSDLDSDS